MIIKIEQNTFKVLDNNETIQTIKLQEIGFKRNSKDAVSFDCQRNQIGIGDIVRVVNGPHQVIIKYFYFFYIKNLKKKGSSRNYKTYF